MVAQWGLSALDTSHVLERNPRGTWLVSRVFSRSKEQSFCGEQPALGHYPNFFILFVSFVRSLCPLCEIFLSRIRKPIALLNRAQQKRFDVGGQQIRVG